MARAPDERIAQAHELYKQGVKLVDIAKQLGVPDGTIRRWKNVRNWDSERSGKKSERSDKKSERSDRKKAGKSDPIQEEFDMAEGAESLTDKQRIFCTLYVRCFNATKAYKKAYGCSYETAMANGSRMLRNAKIQDEISRLKQNRLNRELLTEDDIFQKYMDIAFADITDYIEFGREQVPVMGPFGPIMVKDEKTGKKVGLMQEVNTVRFKESLDVDGTIISEVKQGKSGASIKLADKMKALEWLSEHMNIATEEQKARLQVLRRKAAGGDQEEALKKLDKVLAQIEGVI